MSASQKPLGVLVVGSLPPPVGGTTVTLEFLVEALRQRADVAVSVVDTSGIRGGGLRGLVRLVRAMLDVWRRARAVEVVSLHVATPALPLWGLVVLTLARLARRPFVLRKFADLDYRSRGPVWGRLGHRVVCWSDVYLAETRRHLEEVKARGIRHAHWFPTARPEPGAPRVVVAGARCRRFVYVGLVCRLKGLVELVEAMELLPPEVTLDVYGPITGDLPAGLFERRPGVAYRGPLAPGAVVETMTGNPAA
jgi:glycosyltransferase involved in cell wall biosynthesis